MIIPPAATSVPPASLSADVAALVAAHSVEDVQQRVPPLLPGLGVLARLRREAHELVTGGLAVAIRICFGQELLREADGVLSVKLPVEEQLHLDLSGQVISVCIHPLEDSRGDLLVGAFALLLAVVNARPQPEVFQWAPPVCLAYASFLYHVGPKTKLGFGHFSVVVLICLGEELLRECRGVNPPPSFAINIDLLLLNLAVIVRIHGGEQPVKILLVLFVQSLPFLIRYAAMGHPGRPQSRVCRRRTDEGGKCKMSGGAHAVRVGSETRVQ